MLAGLLTALGALTPAQEARGRATWYDAGPGAYAAAGPALRAAIGPSWRGTAVRVCTGRRCVTAVLSDWCQCHRGTRDERLIDLSPVLFTELAPLGRGKTRVTVSW